MQTNWHRAVLVSLLMIFSSLAGCLSTDEEEEDIGTIMASTYHVQQLVQSIVGDDVTVELMSTSRSHSGCDTRFDTHGWSRTR